MSTTKAIILHSEVHGGYDSEEHGNICYTFATWLAKWPLITDSGEPLELVERRYSTEMKRRFLGEVAAVLNSVYIHADRVEFADGGEDSR